MTALPEPSRPPPKKILRASIGTKFLALLGVMLLISIFTIVLNATLMFKADNLDAISLSSDLLTAAKASQVQIWAEGTLTRGLVLAEGLASGRGNWSTETEILSIRTELRDRTGKLVGARTAVYNEALLKKLGLDRTAEPPEAAMSAIPKTGGSEADLWIHPSGRSVLLLRVLASQTAQASGRILTLCVHSPRLEKMFAASGPYSFALLNSQGSVLAHKNPDYLAVRKKALGELPLVRRAFPSKMDRLVEEVDFENVRYLGAFAKVSVGGMGVLNLVPRSTALETSQTLVRRSILIAALIFFLAIAASHILTESIVGPARELRTATQKIASGNFQGEVHSRSNDEIADLASSFNAMSREISRRIGVLAQINQLALQSRSLGDPQALLDFAIQSLGTLFGFGTAAAFFIEKREGLEPNRFLAKKDFNDPALAKLLKSAMSPDLKAPTWITVGDRAALVCPIINHDEPRGCIVLSGRGAPNEEELSLAQTVVSVFAAELENSTFGRELRAINADLEARVERRTRDLAEANSSLTRAKKEVDDVMANIQQGILTFGADGVINQEFSGYSLEIFGPRPLAGEEAATLLISPELGESRQEDLRDWLRTVFEQPDNWAMLQDFGPKEIVYRVPDAEGNIVQKDLRLEWRPIADGEGFGKLMLVCADITEQKRLQAEIALKEAEHTEQLEIIAQLVNHPRNIVEQFVSDFSRNLETGVAVIDRGVDALDKEGVVELMRALHTIKGAAKQFRLNSIQSRAGLMESDMSQAMEHPPTPDERNTLYEKTKTEFSVLKSSLSRMLALYEKVVHGGSGDAASKDGPSVPVPISKIDKLVTQVFTGNKPVPSRTARKAVGWLLKVSVQRLWDRLDELATGLAPELQKQVVVKREGGDALIDVRILNLLYDGLLHVVRNSLDHGAETPGEREALGKPSALQLTFEVATQKSGLVTVRIRDDGRGVNVEAVRERIITRKLADEAQAKALSDEQVVPYIFLAGFSTKETVTDVSGRGVGMEVVKNIIEKELGGTLQFTSIAGGGTELVLTFEGDALIERPAPKAQALNRAA